MRASAQGARTNGWFVARIPSAVSTTTRSSRMRARTTTRVPVRIPCGDEGEMLKAHLPQQLLQHSGQIGDSDTSYTRPISSGVRRVLTGTVGHRLNVPSGTSLGRNRGETG